METLFGIIAKLFNVRFFSPWQIPTTLTKDSNLEDLQDKFNTLGMSQMAEIVEEDRRRRLRNSYRREITGLELTSSINLIACITILASLVTAIAIFDIKAVAGIIAICVVISGTLFIISSPYLSKDVQKRWVKEIKNQGVLDSEISAIIPEITYNSGRKTESRFLDRLSPKRSRTK